MTKITTATGKEFDTGFVSEYSPNRTLYVSISNADNETVEHIFSDPNETRILHYNGKTFEGYTDLEYIIDEGDSFMVRLKQGVEDAINNNAES